MAESLAERLKRIAAEKKAAREAGQASPVVAPITEVTSDDKVDSVDLAITDSPVGIGETEVSGICGAEKSAEGLAGDVDNLSTDTTGNGASGTELATSNSGNRTDHPLAMKFAELEETLLARDPQFKVILRDIHRHLGQDAELVTQMTEEEIAMVVTGLVLFANTEIVEVAKAKSVKKAVAEAKKKVISADDL